MIALKLIGTVFVWEVSRHYGKRLAIKFLRYWWSLGH